MKSTCQSGRENYGQIILWLCSIENVPNNDEKECGTGRVTHQDWYFWTVVLEKTLESPLDCKEIQPVNPQGNQSWILIGRTDAEAETPILWSPDEKNWLIGKDPDTWKIWRQGEKGTTEDETVGWQSLTWWTWVWACTGCWWLTGKPGRLQSTGLQRVRHGWATELNVSR